MHSSSSISTSSFLYASSFDDNSLSIEVFIVAWMIGFAYWMGFYWLNKSWVFMLNSAFISRYINFLKNFLKECVYAWRDEACSFPHNSCFTICFYNHSFRLMQKLSKTFLFMAHNYVYHISITVQNDEMQDCTFHCIHFGPQLIILHKSLHNWRSTFSKLQIELWNMKIETIYWFISCMVWFDTILIA